MAHSSGVTKGMTTGDVCPRPGGACTLPRNGNLHAPSGARAPEGMRAGPGLLTAPAESHVSWAGIRAWRGLPSQLAGYRDRMAGGKIVGCRVCGNTGTAPWGSVWPEK